MTSAKRSSLPGHSAIYEESNRIISPPPLYRSDTPSVASVSPLITPTASTGFPVSEEDSVKVTVRCRPPSKTELAKNSEACWEVDTTHNNIHLTDLWAAKPGTVFAYGQTASGKTYTMVSQYDGEAFGLLSPIDVRIFKALRRTFICSPYFFIKGTEDEPGVVPRAVNDVFAIISETTEKEFLLRVSYLEIYNETLKDLLAPDSDDLRIHEDKKRGVYVSSLKEEIVTSPRHVMKVIQRGEGIALANALFQIGMLAVPTSICTAADRTQCFNWLIVESREKEPGSMPGSPTIQKHNSFLRTDQRRSVQVSQLNLIDLAGSEKAASQTDRRKEGAFINKSLLTLGTVISKLTEDKVSSHIPYRDSKLTRILQSSLSGNARIAVICTISPSHHNLEESQNTLKFAARVKRIVTAAATNEIIDDKALLQKYRNEINDLRVQLQSNNEVFSRERETNITLLQEKQKLTIPKKHEEQLMEMQLVRTALKERIDHLTKLILTSGSISASKGSNDKPVPSLSNHTKSSPEDRRIDHNAKGESERLRRENTELQIIIDDLRETIRMQATKLEQESNGASQNHEESHGQIIELQELVHNLELNLQHLTDQNMQLEITQGELRAEVERLQTAATMITHESSVQDKELIKSEPSSANDVDHPITNENKISESENQHMEEEFERVKALCTALEQERDSLRMRIKDLQDCMDQSSKTALIHDVPQQLEPKHGTSTSLEKLSDTEDTPDEADQPTEKQSKTSELINRDDPSTIPEAPLSPMFTLGPEIEYIVIALLLSILVYLVVDREDEGMLI
ncbi:hypothetical protein INT44_005280 [Umbelopsis vinacea]|uniref:Kinesin-like protein n=1 Tax=Umbelopsis vinacea TaxID=44442 RepID=A0A8H7QA36_9FUNG|nr:hypothetical protein INT44_005280 [Umbelopsis vinacea]